MPGKKIENIGVDLGRCLLVIDKKVLGTIDNMTIEIAEATLEEVEKVKSAAAITLVRKPGCERGRAGSCVNLNEGADNWKLKGSERRKLEGLKWDPK